MKNITLVLLLAFSLPAFAGSAVKTAGEEETTATATLAAIQEHFKKTMPDVKGDACRASAGLVAAGLLAA